MDGTYITHGGTDKNILNIGRKTLLGRSKTMIKCVLKEIMYGNMDWIDLPQNRFLLLVGSYEQSMILKVP